MRRASEIDSGNEVASVMVGVDFGRSGAVSPAGDPVPFPERVSAFPSSGKGTGLAARKALYASESPNAPTTQPKLILASRLVRESALLIASSRVILPC
jgi:hypothetical protein